MVFCLFAKKYTYHLLVAVKKVQIPKLDIHFTPNINPIHYINYINIRIYVHTCLYNRYCIVMASHLLFQPFPLLQG